MSSAFVPGILGILLIVLGVRNMQGDISSLHWYHRQRVSEADRKPFGRQTGLGTLIIGVAMVIAGILFWISEETAVEAWLIAGSVITIAGIVVGLAITFHAMIKYNKGIF